MNDADPTPLITDPLAPTPLIDSSLTSKNTPVPSHNEAVAAASGIVSNASILSYSTRPPKHTRQRTLASFNFTKERTVKKASRVISQTPTKVLDAPFMVDDYYLNLLDWSCHNVVAIALERSVYLWNAESGTTTLLDTDSDESVTSLIWSEDGTMLAVAKDNGTTDLWDAYQNTRLRSMEGPNCRVGVLSWDKCIVSGGAQNGIIYNHDVRLKEHKVSEWAGHDEEVCGLEWRSDGGFLASGGNDNLINVWDNRFTTPIMTRREHISAVKALAWCPWNPNILASGGGRDDKKIHFWDTIKNKIITTFTADSQITSLQWSLQHREIASTHGMPHNNIIVWDYDTGNTIADIKAHDSRILHSALSPDGEVLATSSADENLKFWTIFEQKNTTLQANTEKKIANRLKRTGSLR
ncbi:WD40-repeat-containing domain protein [Spinellus fusiger]|nr:WD40-repeat-containing domain protein [Spinellus fusiger]